MTSHATADDDSVPDPGGEDDGADAGPATQIPAWMVGMADHLLMVRVLTAGHFAGLLRDCGLDSASAAEAVLHVHERVVDRVFSVTAVPPDDPTTTEE